MDRVARLGQFNSEAGHRIHCPVEHQETVLTIALRSTLTTVPTRTATGMRAALHKLRNKIKRHSRGTLVQSSDSQTPNDVQNETFKTNS